MGGGSCGDYRTRAPTPNLRHQREGRPALQPGRDFDSARPLAGGRWQEQRQGLLGMGSYALFPPNFPGTPAPAFIQSLLGAVCCGGRKQWSSPLLGDCWGLRFVFLRSLARRWQGPLPSPSPCSLCSCQPSPKLLPHGGELSWGCRGGPDKFAEWGKAWRRELTR